jgi:non-specific protein-tyrosine kinase
VREHRATTVSEFLAVLRRRKWIVALVVAAAVASSLYVSSRQSPLYRASAQVLLSVNPVDNVLGGGGTRLSSDEAARYASTQAKLADGYRVARAAVESAGVADVSPDELLRSSSVSASADSDVLTFAVTDGDRERAAILANAFAREYVAYSRAQDVANVRAVLRAVDRRIRALRREVRKEQAGRGTVSAALKQEFRVLVARQQDLQTEEQIQTGSSRLAEAARDASQVQPRPLQDAALGLLVGVVLAFALAFLLEALDTRARSVEEIAERLGMPLLARLPPPPRRLRGNHGLVMLADERPDATAPYWKLRSAVDFANVSLHARTIMVTSALEQEGKSTVVANLAVALTRVGRRVLLVDMDLRRPSLDRFFGLDGRPGLTDVVLGYSSLEEAIAPVVVTGERGLAATGNGNGVPRADGLLHVLPSGPTPPHPDELLESAPVGALFDELEALENFDVILFDTPPLLPVSDAIAISHHAAGLIVVVRASRVRRAVLAELRRLLDQCRSAKVGFVLTDAEADGAYGYGSYGAYAGPPADAVPVARGEPRAMP